MSSYFEIYANTNEQYHWRLKAGNGEIVAQGEAYEQKSSAIEAANKLKDWSNTDDIREI